MSDEVTTWLARTALPLSSLTAGVSTADLRPLKGILDGVRIVGLGEATHGTSEFFQLKHRLLEFLVEELGFSVLAMEASASAGPAVDAYVCQGVGDAAGVLAGLGFWTWRTHEVLGMIEWMRAYNRGRPEERKVRFVGIDPQQCGDSLAVLGSFLRKVAPDREAGLLSPLRVLAKAYPGSQPGPQRRLVQDAEELLGFLDGRGPGAADAIRHARILVQAADLVTRARQHTDPEQTVFAARDRYMAEAVEELLSDPSTKIALWAHNGHIGKGRSGGAVPSMGQHLHTRHGDAYYALGLLFGSGSFRARRMWPGPCPWSRPRAGAPVTNRIGPARPDAVEAQLATASPGDHLVDLRSAANAPTAVREWLNGRHRMRSFGAMVPRWIYRFNLSPASLAEEYDGLAYVAVSTGSRPLPTS
ncbi:erythromycin esterase family protein [Streptomyces sp. AK04-3B]|uniref:erythromycin esterase family protein n=1 Tax=Streptomyces sp. AK04-3B TaxID=3028650 RepID=UPI0029AE7538|nr:erythromycin esterase family protein [Streptomyces sp. AK04-3B]MDX3798862.1 erythromycin esterase family protein [Streptomyces sp. AK04-3B]